MPVRATVGDYAREQEGVLSDQIGGPGRSAGLVSSALAVRKVPLLPIDGSQVVFESSVINEFIDEVTPGRPLPDDPLKRALNRSRIEYGSLRLPLPAPPNSEPGGYAARSAQHVGRFR